MLVEVAANIPFTFGGSADVASSVKTAIPGDPGFDAEHRSAKNINWGIREFAMAAAQNGMLLPGGLTTYVGCFEQLVALRSIPGVEVLRPADTRECFAAWRLALETKDHPVCLILSRQNLRNLEKSSLENVANGAYVAKKEEKADLELIATGSEVGLALDAATLLKEKGIKASVISMPSCERFDKLPQAKKDAIITLPKAKRVAIEMLSGLSWYKYADNVISQDGFGYSAPAEQVMDVCGFTAEKVAAKIAKLIA